LELKPSGRVFGTPALFSVIWKYEFNIKSLRNSETFRITHLSMFSSVTW
jgi:hypothetical protein